MRIDETCPDPPGDAFVAAKGSADNGASFRFGFRQYSTAATSFTTPDQGGSGEKCTFASGNPVVLTDQLGPFSWSNFLQDVNHVSGWVSNGAGIVAMGCAATIVCAPAAPIIGGVAAVGAAVNVASGVAISGASCTDLKGSCSGAVATAAIVGIGSRFGAGKLVSRAASDTVAMGRNMTERVIPYAQRHGFGYYAGTPRWVPRQTLARVTSGSTVEKIDLYFNRQWIRGQMRNGNRIVDIGEPAGYRRSEFYEMELKEVRGYQNYEQDIQP